MAEITTDHIKALIAASIVNNKQGVINAMNQTGNTVSESISDSDLIDSAYSVFTQKGLEGLKNILSKVQIDKTKDTSYFIALDKIFGGSSQMKCGLKDLMGCLQSAGDIIGGSTTSTTGGAIQNTTTQSLLSPSVIIGLSIVAIVAISLLIFRLTK
jgi:hypothetical protein